jgi:hypothetical protein
MAGIPLGTLSGSLQGGNGVSLQGSTPSLQGSSPNLQGSSPNLQGSTPNLQPSISSMQASANASQNSINSSIAQNNSMSADIAALLKSIQAETLANAPGVAPSLDINALNAQAQSKAQGTVNPLYTQYLNQYLQQESANKQAAQSQNTLNLQGEQSNLGNTLAQNTLAQGAAGRGNALTQGNINAQQTNYQLQSGNAQNSKMQAIESTVGSGNLSASGLGQQQVYQAENSRNAADAAQSGQFQYQRDTSNLSTQDTFAQLAQSSQYATTAEGQQEAQTNFNLNDYLRQAAYNDTQYRQANESSRQQALTATGQQNEAQLIQEQLSAANPTGSKNYAAGEAAYSNLLNPSMGLPTAPDQNQYLQQAGAAI